MVLGKLPVPGRPTLWITVGQGPTALAVGAGGGCLDIFTLIYPFSSLSPSLWETARYRLKYCLKGPLNPKQPTNQIEQIKNCIDTMSKKPTSCPLSCLMQTKHVCTFGNQVTDTGPVGPFVYHTNNFLSCFKDYYYICSLCLE